MAGSGGVVRSGGGTRYSATNSFWFYMRIAFFYTFNTTIVDLFVNLVLILLYLFPDSFFLFLRSHEVGIFTVVLVRCWWSGTSRIMRSYFSFIFRLVDRRNAVHVPLAFGIRNDIKSENMRFEP